MTRPTFEQTSYVAVDVNDYQYQPDPLVILNSFRRSFCGSNLKSWKFSVACFPVDSCLVIVSPLFDNVNKKKKRGALVYSWSYLMSTLTSAFFCSSILIG